MGAGAHAGAPVAPTVHLYADTAPNVFGSPAWGPWWTATKDDMGDSVFVNMRTGAYEGEGDANNAWMQPYEEIVYSTGDLGLRLHTLFWIPGETTASLAGRFQMRYVLDWDGEELIYDFGLGDYVAYDGPTTETGWTVPVSSWENHGSGVAGRPGWAWWAVDDDALPLSTDADPYNETDADDVEALARILRSAHTFFRLEIRTRATPSDPWGNYNSMQVTIKQPELILQAKDTCVNAEETLFVDVIIDNDAEAYMAGVQTIVDFDDSRLAFMGATAVAPFPMAIELIEDGNTIAFANGVGMGDPEINTPGTFTVARLEFLPLAGSSGCSIADLVTFSSYDGFESTITDESATPILHGETAMGTVTIDLIDPTLVGVPADVSTACDAGETYATVPVTPPTATDNLICGAPVVTVVVIYPDSSTDTALPAGDQYPIGITTLEWWATDSCGNTSISTTSITVADANVLNLNITLSGSVGGSHSRNVRVRWGTGLLNAVVPVTFTGANGTASVSISPAGVYTCITVKDELHTLADAVTPTTSLGEYHVTAFLTQGDSNNDNKVDILDFGLFVGDYGPAAVNGRSNFNADAFVNSGDFGFISAAFFDIGESCGSYLADGPAPLSSISVRTLVAMGLSEMVVADLDGDGWVDVDDMALFMQGAVPLSGNDQLGTK